MMPSCILYRVLVLNYDSLQEPAMGCLIMRNVSYNFCRVDILYKC